MFSRRDFLHLGSLALPGLLLPRWSLDKALPGRPDGELALGLFFDAGALPALRRRFEKNPLFAGLRERLRSFDRENERRFLTSEIDYNNRRQHLKRVTQTARTMAFLYLMTGSEEAAALAEQSVDALMNFETWDIFLEAGTEVLGIQRASDATLATALNADWLGEHLDEQKRTRWIRTMGERGCAACFRTVYGMRYPRRVEGWTKDPESPFVKANPGRVADMANWPTILDQTNLKVIPAAALAIGAAAYRRHLGESSDTKRWLEQAQYSLRTFESLYTPDGSYREGVGYAKYATKHYAQGISILHRFGIADLYDRVNWPGLIDFFNEMSIPTDEYPSGMVNFGDGWNGYPPAVAAWIARRSHSSSAQYMVKTQVQKQSPWSLIWYDPSVAATSPPAPARPHLWISDLDWAVARTGYAADDFALAMRSGDPNNHEHADRNSIILKSFGERLVDDPRKAPYGHGSPSFIMRRTAGHSALLIDGEGHQYHQGYEGTNPSPAHAKIVRDSEQDGYAFWSSDASPAYHLALPDVESVTRTAVVFYELPAALLLDKVVKAESPSTIQARFFAYNNDGNAQVQASGADAFQIRRPGAVLHGRAHAPAGLRVTTDRLPIPEKKARQHPFVEVGTQEAQLDPLLITALLPKLPKETAEAPASAQITASEDAYDITIKRGGQTQRCRVFDSGTIPEFEVMS